MISLIGYIRFIDVISFTNSTRNDDATKFTTYQNNWFFSILEDIT